MRTSSVRKACSTAAAVLLTAMGCTFIAAERSNAATTTFGWANTQVGSVISDSVGGDTLMATSSLGVASVASVAATSVLGLPIAGLTGNILLTSALGPIANVRLSLQGNKRFDLMAWDQAGFGDALQLTLTTNKGSVNVSSSPLVFGSTHMTFNQSVLQGVNYVDISTVSLSLGLDNIVLDQISNLPTAPTIGSVVAGDAQASVAFTAPSDNGGSSVTSYTVTANPGGQTAVGFGSPLSVNGLANGTAYSFRVSASNANGTGALSVPSSGVTPLGVQTVSFGEPGTQVYGTSPTLTATASSGLAVSWNSTTPAVCSVTGGGVLSFPSVGTCTISANQPGSAFFAAATPVSRSFIVAASAPGAPTVGVVLPGDGDATVAFVGPVSDGGSPVTAYTITASPGGAVATGTASPLTVTGLANGTPYSFRVSATNNSGESLPSAPSAAVTPLGGQAIVFANPGPQTFGTSPTLSASASSGLPISWSSNTPLVCVVSGSSALTLLSVGTCTVSALQTGNGVFAAASPIARTFAVAASVSGPPSIGAVTAGDGQVEVSFTAPASDGGSAINSYTVTANPGGATGTGSASPLIVAGLANGTAYTFTVVATNGAGVSLASSASAAATPIALSTTTSSTTSSTTSTTLVPSTVVPTLVPTLVPSTLVPTLVPSTVVSTLVPSTVVPTLVPTLVPSTVVPTLVPTLVPSSVVPIGVATSVLASNPDPGGSAAGSSETPVPTSRAESGVATSSSVVPLPTVLPVPTAFPGPSGVSGVGTPTTVNVERPGDPIPRMVATVNFVDNLVEVFVYDLIEGDQVKVWFTPTDSAIRGAAMSIGFAPTSTSGQRVLLGRATADKTGTVHFTAQLPGAWTGSATVEAIVINRATVPTIVVPVTVAPVNELAFTGSNAGAVVRGAMSMLLLGGVLLMVASFRVCRHSARREMNG